MSAVPNEPPRPVTTLDEARQRRVARKATAPDALSTYWEAYKASARWADAPESTRRAYAFVLDRACRELPARPCAADVELWLAQLAVRDELSAATRNKYLAYMKGVASFGARVTHAHDVADELAQLRRTPVEVRQPRCPPDEAVWAVFAVAEGPGETLAARLACYGGLRKGELAALRPESAERVQGVTYLHVRKTRDRYGVRKRKNARSGKPHVVKLDPVTAELLWLLAEHSEHRALLAAKAGLDGPLAEGWLLPWSAEYLDDSLLPKWRRRDAVVRAHVTGFHDFRHWGATRVAKMTGSVIHVQAFLGDATPSAAQGYIACVRGTTMGLADQLALDFEGPAGGPGGARGASEAGTAATHPGGLPPSGSALNGGASPCEHCSPGLAGATRHPRSR